MSEASASSEAASPPGPIVGLGILVIVVAAIIGWVVVGGHYLSEISLFGGFLMLWYWANVEQLSIKRLPAALIGALVGIGLAWLLFKGTVILGDKGGLIGLVVLILALYLDILKAVPLLINASTMLYVTVAAAPLVGLKVDWLELCFATVGGGLFFAAFVEAVKWIAGKVMPAAK
ncbi:hypothetical protein [Novosphingobium sp.]|uniref:hypothetical protein n=1 Tax=Novosphingobium sp. TaxID=1874826 RepID=UPI0035B18AE0